MNSLVALLTIYLLTAILCSGTSKWPRAAGWISQSAFISAFVLVLWMYFSEQTFLFDVRWFSAGSFVFNITLQANPNQFPVLLFTTLVAALVSIYSVNYFDRSESPSRFFQTLGLFMFSMMGLLLSANLFLTFVFWELVGLSSYLLIGYYRQSPEAGPASLKAMLLNKTGDTAFMIGLLLCWNIYGTFDLNTLTTATPADESRMFLLGLTIFIAITAKSAQLPLHGWLADAMAGPTPVSALIHSATMVAAGIFLLGQYPMLFIPSVRELAGYVGLITALIAGWNALSQIKIKRLLAWSTMSQLGLMVMTSGWYGDAAAGLHLMFHGIAKAGLFLIAGTLLLAAHHSSQNNETSPDLKTPEFGASLSKTGAISVLIVAASLAGIPFTTGFISKENIASGFSGFELAGFILINLLTLLYLARLLWFIQPVKNFKSKAVFNKGDFSPIILALLSLWISFSPDLTGESNYFKLEIHSGNISAYLSLGFLGFGLLVIAFLWQRNFFNRLEVYAPPFYPDQYYHRFFTFLTLGLSRTTTFTDTKIIDGLVHGKAYVLVMASHLTTFLDHYVVDFIMSLPALVSRLAARIFRAPLSGQITSYLWWTICGVLILLFMYF
jgi:NADH-quinone oxidoreductase subunit L